MYKSRRALSYWGSFMPWTNAVQRQGWRTWPPLFSITPTIYTRMKKGKKKHLPKCKIWVVRSVTGFFFFLFFFFPVLGFSFFFFWFFFFFGFFVLFCFLFVCFSFCLFICLFVYRHRRRTLPALRHRPLTDPSFPVYPANVMQVYELHEYT